MTFEPSPQQALAIFSMIFGRAAEEQHPTKKELGLAAAQRAQLVKHGLVEFTKLAPRVERASVSEIGWAWAVDHLDSALPDKPAIWQVALSGVLARLREHLANTNASLAEFAPGTELPAIHATVKRPTVKKNKRKAPASNVAAKPSANKRSKSGSPANVAKAHTSGKPRTKAKKLDAGASGRSKRRSAAPKKTIARKKSAAKNQNSASKTTKKPLASKNAALKRGAVESASSLSKLRAVAGSAATALSRNKRDLESASTASSSLKPNANGHGELAALIRRACLELGGGSTRVRVRLRDVRRRLPDVPRAQLDQSLQQLQLDGALVLYRIDDPTDISREDASAALHIAGHPRHILYLEH